MKSFYCKEIKEKNMWSAEILEDLPVQHVFIPCTVLVQQFAPTAVVIVHLHPSAALRPELGDVIATNAPWVLKCDGSACCINLFLLPQLDRLSLFSHLM